MLPMIFGKIATLGGYLLLAAIATNRASAIGLLRLWAKCHLRGGIFQEDFIYLEANAESVVDQAIPFVRAVVYALSVAVWFSIEVVKVN